MSRPLRKRRTPLILNPEEYVLQRKSSNKLSVTSKKSSRVVSPAHVGKKRITRACRKIQEQDENFIPQIEKAVGTEKININERVSNLKSHPSKYDTKNKSMTLLVKSPVLRDRTNGGSDLTKIDFSKSKVFPISKQRVLTEKLEINVSFSDESVTQINSRRENSENLQKIPILKESGANALPLVERISLPENNACQGETKLEEQKASRTRSGKISVEKNKVQDDLLPKSKKFFKFGNTNKLTNFNEKAAVKETGRKRKFVKKTTMDDSSFSLHMATPDKISHDEKKTLRPRQALKNYCEESKLIEQLSPTKRNSLVVIERLSQPNAKKLPIWKSVKFPELERKDKDVYDLTDGDFSNEEKRPKKKKRTIKKPIKRLKKTAASVKIVEEQKPVKPIRVPETSEQVLKMKKDFSNLDPQIQPKPKMVSMEILNNTKKINVLPTPPVPEPVTEFRPFRVTQVFHPRSTMQNNMLDHSLLSKSMSPITKITENINPATPWRIPTVESFSCVRNLVQSTPQHNKITPSFSSLTRRSTMHDKPKMNRIEEDQSENVQETTNKSKNNTDSNSMKLIERPKNKNEIVPEIRSTETTVQNSFLFDNDEEDKENAVPHNQSPQKKSPKKNNWMGTPVLEPQPGPSGLQRQPLREAKILRQTNLNNFLSLDDTPERTELRTPYGIFDDIHSTPINGKPLKKINEPDIQNAFGFDDDYVDVSPIVSENIQAIPFIPKGVLCEKGVENGKVKLKSICRNPLRLSAKEILKTLHQRRIENEANVENNVKIMNHEKLQHVNEHENERKDLVERKEKRNDEKENITINFSDTFDLLKEQEEQRVERLGVKELSSVPLFADLEPPTRFSTPPKCIYKRKRAVRFSYSEGSEDEENYHMEKEETKKKAKKSNKENKKLNEWAKNINKTFDEIDNFDLVVE